LYRYAEAIPALMAVNAVNDGVLVFALSCTAFVMVLLSWWGGCTAVAFN
jgi:hypothetical protein